MSDSNNTNNDTPAAPRGLNIEALKAHVIAHKIDVCLWTIRILTILFTIGYFVPLIGTSQNAYYKALIANAATSALRLHQRMGGFSLSRELIARLLTEDSCHYLLYSLIFLYVTPVTWVLIPIVLFAVLHASSYALTLLDALGQNCWWGARLLISLVEFQSRNILRAASLAEIIMMPYTVILIFMGRAGLLTPFIYYHFLMQRYVSRRNPYTRNMFRELRDLVEHIGRHRSTPAFVTKILNHGITFVCKLAPQPQPQQ
ncbi:PREDICTED: Krueppel homolog 2 [Nicrophorus vespilloides]|uniref:Krueppel homolog 2 n=1 Tax=Nicrophorus vespilloides TaxID=110193 RepID=A0ABM1NAA6_NICVS|nr:PREDICTED: Krueppel homolog 2 [Nicrophorus vespilloides]